MSRVRDLLGGSVDLARTRSAAEDRFLELVRAAGLPHPATNVRLGRYEVDFLWRPARVVVEIDGFTYHSSPGSFEADHRRDGDLTDAGYAVVRFTWRQLQDEPLVVLRRVIQALERSESAGSGVPTQAGRRNATPPGR